jgi:hypothetical protein
VSFDLRKKSGRFSIRKAANLLRDKARENAKPLDDPMSATDLAANVAAPWPKTFRLRLMNS